MLPDHQPEVDPALADAVRDAFVCSVDPATARRHLSAIVAAADAGSQPAPRRSRARRPMWRTGLAAGAATLLLPVGLSFAGVPLPAVVEKSYRAIGLDLPESPREAPYAPATVPRSTTPATPTAEPSIERDRSPAGEGRAGDGRADRRQARRTRRADANAAEGRRRDSRGAGQRSAANGGVPKSEAEHRGGIVGSSQSAGQAEPRRTRERPGQARPERGVPAPRSAPGQPRTHGREQRSPDSERRPAEKKSHEQRAVPDGTALPAQGDAARQQPQGRRG